MSQELLDEEAKQNKRRNVVKQLLIVSLVVFAGIFFGVGDMSYLTQSADRDQEDIRRLDGICRNLQDIINPDYSIYQPNFVPVYDMNQSYSPRRYPMSYEHASQMHALTLKKAHLAEREGLSPKGEVLEMILKTFLNTKVGDREQRPIGHILDEYSRSPKAVSRDSLLFYLKTTHAGYILRDVRAGNPPIIPTMVGKVLASFESDTITCLDAEFDVATFIDDKTLAAVKDDAIQAEYEKMKDSFKVEASATLALITASAKDIAPLIIVPEAQILAEYEKEKDLKYRLPAAPGDATNAAIRYRPLSEVRTDIHYALAKEPAKNVARDLCKRFDQYTIKNKEKLLQPDTPFALLIQAAQEISLGPDVQPLLSRPATLAVLQNIPVTSDAGGNFSLGVYGVLKGYDIFKNPVGWTSTFTPPKMIDEETGRFATLHLSAKRDATWKDLKDPAVRSKVVQRLATQKAYGNALNAAKLLITTAPKGATLGAMLPHNPQFRATATSTDISVASSMFLVLSPSEDPSKEDTRRGEPLIAHLTNDAASPILLLNGQGSSETGPKLRLLQPIKLTRTPVDDAGAERSQYMLSQQFSRIASARINTELRAILKD
jgi:hypothetical protein